MKRLSRYTVFALLISALACEAKGPAARGRGQGGTTSARTDDSGADAGAGGTVGTSGGGINSAGGLAAGGSNGGTTDTDGTAGRSGTGANTAGGSSAATDGTGAMGGGRGTADGGTSAGRTTGGSSGSAAGTSGPGGTTVRGGTTGAGGSSATGGGSNSSGGRTPGTGGATAGGGSSQPAASGCTSCHGDSTTNNPAPPVDTEGNTDSSSPGVGAHSRHLGAALWHRQGKCADCHTQPTSAPHSNGKVDLTWGAPGNAGNARPNFSTTSLTCAGTYCHGTTLAGASTVKTTPVWNQVDGTWNECGTACHATPPPASAGHPTSTSCEKCHSKVIASFAANSPTTTWKDASLHVNGTVETDTLTCTSCHGSGNSPAPPKDTQGGTATSAPGVGAHAQHLGTATWHRQGQCEDCHATPTSTVHANNTVDFSWGATSTANGATPSFNATDFSCSGTYCHGAKMTDKSASVGHAPIWTKVDGTHDACGKACHANPPASGSHSSSSTACQNCHGDVISSYNGASSTWKNSSLHINGKVEATAQTCSSCHGNPPNSGTHTRREHRVTCTYCHPDPNGSTHRNGTTNVTCGSSRAGCHEGGD